LHTHRHRVSLAKSVSLSAETRIINEAPGIRTWQNTRDDTTHALTPLNFLTTSPAIPADAGAPPHPRLSSARGSFAVSSKQVDIDAIRGSIPIKIHERIRKWCIRTRLLCKCCLQNVHDHRWYATSGGDTFSEDEVRG
jgi:hypothetical protein